MDIEDDPFLWLEDVEGERALAWVREQNEGTLARLQSDPLYQVLYDKALAILQAKDRVPFSSPAKDDIVGNFWQDETNIRGIWRRTTLDSYRTDNPEWETLLDIDELAATENKNWVYQGGPGLSDSSTLSLEFLSDGGKDAYEFREFNRQTRTFIKDGFNAPEAKQSVSWLDEDTLLIARDWGEGTLTTSGYPYIVKQWKRGQPLAEAEELFRGTPEDTRVDAWPLRSSDFTVQAILFSRSISFFEQETYILTPAGARLLPLPRRVSGGNLVKGQWLLTLDEDWPDQGLKAGDLASCDFAALRDRNELHTTLIFRPTERQSLSGQMTTRDKLVIGVLENVQGKVIVGDYVDGQWLLKDLELPRDTDVGLSSCTRYDNRIVLMLDNFLMPVSQWLIDLDEGTTEILKTAPGRFDVSGLVSEQLHAVSPDGTSIPYFVVRRQGETAPQPTLLYAYGGFQISLNPGYSGLRGKLWLERGGTYVLANIRGGGEFGPAWHEAGRKENRQRIYDDFHAVAEDLIRRGITTPAQLGIEGGSNGGLLMGVAMTQRPDLYAAVNIRVPLLDMLRYTVMGGAGASWIGEYGDPMIPEERAYIEKYSPYQNLKPGQPYPEALITTSTRDDRVIPGHARKFAARLMQLGYPVLYYEDIDGGHSAGANLIKVAMKAALEYTYLHRKLAGEAARL